MSKPLALAIALALLAPACAFAHEEPATAAQAATPAWVARSNAHAQLLLDAEATFFPERASATGLSQYDGLAVDLAPRAEERRREALAKVKAEYESRLRSESDAEVRKDLRIMIDTIALRIEGSRQSSKYERDWSDMAQGVFRGQQQLLQKQTAAARHPKAVERLQQRYVGLFPGTTSVFTLATERYAEGAGKGLMEPTKLEVDQALANAATYVEGVSQAVRRVPAGGRGARARGA